MTKTLQTQIISEAKSYKYLKLFVGIICDFIGMSSYVFEPASELMDVVWAPFSAFILSKMYKGNVGKIAATIDFIEELLPETDIIPTFTLTWIYVYVIRKEK